jgi:hypothetical protein
MLLSLVHLECVVCFGRYGTASGSFWVSPVGKDNVACQWTNLDVKYPVGTAGLLLATATAWMVRWHPDATTGTTVAHRATAATATRSRIGKVTTLTAAAIIIIIIARDEAAMKRFATRTEL